MSECLTNSTKEMLLESLIDARKDIQKWIDSGKKYALPSDHPLVSLTLSNRDIIEDSINRIAHIQDCDVPDDITDRPPSVNIISSPTDMFRFTGIVLDGRFDDIAEKYDELQMIRRQGVIWASGIPIGNNEFTHTKFKKLPPKLALSIIETMNKQKLL